MYKEDGRLRSFRELLIRNRVTYPSLSANEINQSLFLERCRVMALENIPEHVTRSSHQSFSVQPIQEASAVTQAREAFGVSPIQEASAVTSVRGAFGVTPIQEASAVTPIHEPFVVKPIMVIGSLHLLKIVGEGGVSENVAIFIFSHTYARQFICTRSKYLSQHLFSMEPF